MKRIDKILNHPMFIDNLKKIDEFEKDRKFCKHGITHLLDVARIGSIILAQKKVDSGDQIESIADEYMYAAALLHDLGRVKQYQDGVPHEEASARVAEVILADCCFDDEEIQKIANAILKHRSALEIKEGSLEAALYKADKASRCCFTCKAWDECKWSGEDKNYTIIF